LRYTRALTAIADGGCASDSVEKRVCDDGQFGVE
jgi:hypothetical protein